MTDHKKFVTDRELQALKQQIEEVRRSINLTHFARMGSQESASKARTKEIESRSRSAMDSLKHQLCNTD